MPKSLTIAEMLESRELTSQEMKKRGCRWCLDYRRGKRCKYFECPYHELDGYSTYEQYLKEHKPDRKLLMEILLP